MKTLYNLQLKEWSVNSLKNAILCVTVILLFYGCKQTTVSSVAPDFNIPHIVNAKIINGAFEINYSISHQAHVSLWVTKGVGPGEEVTYLESGGMGELFVSKMLPTKILVDKIQSGGNHQITWDGTDEQGNMAAEGYYRIYLRADSFNEYKDYYLQRK